MLLLLHNSDEVFGCFMTGGEVFNVEALTVVLVGFDVGGDV